MDVRVQASSVVNALYKRGQWLFVKTADELTGFIPYQNTEPVYLKKSENFSQQFPEERTNSTRSVRTSSARDSLQNLRPLSDLDNHRTQRQNIHAAKTRTSFNESIDSTRGSLSNASITSNNMDNNGNLTKVYNNHQNSNMKQLQPRLRESVDSARGPSPDDSFSSSRLFPCADSIRTTSKQIFEIYQDRGNAFKQHSNASFISCRTFASSDRPTMLDSSPTSKPESLACALSFDKLSQTNTSVCFSESVEPLELTMLFDFEARCENEVTVYQNDVVTVLNDDNEDWYWVRTEDGSEGFIPSNFTVNLQVFNLDPHAKTTYC
jgi:hypothetical protein